MATETHCKIALDQYEQDLGRRKNVVGLGIVSTKEAEGDNRGRDCAVGVYVRKKLPDNRLPAKELIPETLEIKVGKRGVKVPTRVIEQGDVQLESLE